ncbi:MAG: META domain-containing protein [Desulfobacterales bacterium]
MMENLHEKKLAAAVLAAFAALSAGCTPPVMGGYRLTGEGLTFDQMAGSMMACEEPLSRQEARFLGLLQDTVRFEIDPSGRLLLHTKSGQNIGARR